MKRANEFNIELEDVSITHMTFGKEFTRAVEQKQIAQQDAERARFTVEKVISSSRFLYGADRQAEQERQANVIRAEGEAESADMIAKAIERAGDGLIKIRSMEASKEVHATFQDVAKKQIAQTLAGKQGVMYVPGGGGKSGDGKDAPNLLLNI